MAPMPRLLTATLLAAVTFGCSAAPAAGAAVANGSVPAGSAERDPAMADGPRHGAAIPAPTVGDQILRVTSTVSIGPGSIGSAIEAANRNVGGETTIVFELDPGATIYVFRALPEITGTRVTILANGALLKGGSCVRPDGKKGCSGLVLRGSEIVVRDLHAENFTFDGVAVIGPRARDVQILGGEFRNNLDDGVGISGAAQGVLVEDCLLEGNGFRTKGKGILVFDASRATLRRNIIRGNRDGITVSRYADALLELNRIEANFDKGLGVSGATVRGSRNYIGGNGRTPRDGEQPPNADGLRVGLTSSVTLSETLIEDNGDSGVVALNDSTVVLAGGHVIGNGGAGIVARGTARVSLDKLTVGGNGKGHVDVTPPAVVLGLPGPR